MVLSAAILMTGLTASAWADAKVSLFSGELQGVELGSWGAGTVEVDEDETYLEGAALRVETTGFFEGGRLDLAEPLEMDRFMEDPAGGYVKLVVKVHEPELETFRQPGAGEGRFPGGMPGPIIPGEGMPPGGMPPEGMPGEFGPGMPPEGGMMPPEGMPGEMMPGEMGPGMPGEVPGGMGPGMPGEVPGGMGPGMGVPGAGQVGAAAEPPPKIEALRVLIVTDKGAIDSGALELEQQIEVVEGWKQIVVPLSAFGGTVDLSGSKIEYVALLGDVEESFWVGELTLGYEEQPLVADAGENVTTTVEEITRFEAAPQAEGVQASYVWDFDALDGIQEEGYGQEPTWTFLTPGYYTVTLRVSDPQGEKVDRIDTVEVKVEE
ncbi:MAG: PKD domain-containing protein [Armatimonadota bacterium]|nr:PKD domain-containing protein [Armatimonadota bacterium]